MLTRRRVQADHQRMYVFFMYVAVVGFKIAEASVEHKIAEASIEQRAKEAEELGRPHGQADATDVGQYP